MLKSLSIALVFTLSLSATAMAAEKKVSPQSKGHIETVSFTETTIMPNVTVPMRIAMEKATAWLKNQNSDRIISVTQTSACVGNTPCTSMVTIVYILN